MEQWGEYVIPQTVLLLNFAQSLRKVLARLDSLLATPLLLAYRRYHPASDRAELHSTKICAREYGLCSR
jgi:hypothetical protein